MNSHVNTNVLTVCTADKISPVGRCVAVLISIAVMLGAASATHADITGITGGSQSHANIQPSLAVSYIIALQGIYPSRSITTGEEAGAPSLNLSGSEPFIGEVTMFGGNFAPRGWALADGQLLAISSNEALFSILGTTFGGDGRTTFGLPDLRGRMPLGPRTGPGLSPRALGQKGGADTATVNAPQLASHGHTLPAPIYTTQNTGGSQGHPNMQPFQGMNYIMAIQGLFPPRNIGDVDTVPIDASGTDPYIGGVTMFGGNFAPRNWAFCDGQLLPISSYQSLFSILGTTYGGDGRTTFALPDLRGRTAIGQGHGAGLTNRRLGDRFGSETASLSGSQLPSHTHSPPPPSSIVLGDTGNNQAHDNMAPSLGMNYVIALQGTFPSRNITIDGTDASVTSSDPFLGEISLFAGNFAPRGWAFCEGQILPITSYTALFSILGTTYGGDGRSTFGLPDLRGRAALHEGHGPGLSSWKLGQKGGAETVQLNVNQMAAHNHIVDPAPSDFGDLDGDWDIDQFDYNTFIGQFGMTAPPGVLAGDIDDDGDVDLDDFSLLRQGFGFGVPAPPASAPPAAGAAIPEPATLCLLAFGGLAALRRRRK
jgi:microcystin-dependent protein